MLSERIVSKFLVSSQHALGSYSLGSLYFELHRGNVQKNLPMLSSLTDCDPSEIKKQLLEA